MNNVLLITKLKTTNIGNQALSDELVKLYEKSTINFHVTGRPTGLFGYSIEKLVRQKDPVRAFEKWADNLVNNLKNSPPTLFQRKSKFVELLSFDDFKVKNDGLFQAIKNTFRKYIHTETLFARAYRNRYSLLAGVDAVVYSGAGEVGDNNIFLRQLIELRVAQKLGKRTMAINQSVEVVEEPMQSICAHVYKNMDKILVRGHVSRDNMIKIGIPSTKIECCPDSAFLNAAPSSEQVESLRVKYNIVGPAVGINATKVAADLTRWDVIIKELRTVGYNVYYVTNDPFGDQPIARQMESRYAMPAILEFMPYSEYTALLANFRFVISCRLHTNELSLTAGTPIVPIEGSHFKTREVFSLVRYPLSVVNPSSSDWELNVVNGIQVCHGTRDVVQKFVDDLNNVRHESQRNLVH